MADYTIGSYSTAPRGLTSNTGFEAEDAARAARLAQNAINAQFHRAAAENKQLAEMLWQQDKTRRPANERDFVERFTADIAMVMREFAKDGVLPEDGKNP